MRVVLDPSALLHIFKMHRPSEQKQNSRFCHLCTRNTDCILQMHEIRNLLGDGYQLLVNLPTFWYVTPLNNIKSV